MGTVLGGLLLPQFQPYDAQRTALNAINAAGGMVNTQTGLLQLADLRRQQATDAFVRQALQQDPSLLGLGGGGGGGPQSLLGSPDLTAGAGGPMTQQTVLPGQAPGAPQVVPGGQDLSRFATGGPPAGGPQPTLATLGPQPRPDPLEALVRQNPDAALQIMQQRFKLQEQQLTMRSKVASSVGQLFQTVTDQASYDAARRELQGFAPHLAARLSQVYSKEVRDRLVAQSQSAKDNAETALAEARATKATQEAQTEQWKRETFLPKILEESPAPTAGGEAPPTTGSSTTATTPPGRQVTAPAEVETAVQEAVRLYPQVRPELVRAIIAQESNFQQKAVSPKGAQGYMQLMPGTAKDLGVEDAFDTKQNIHGGVRYFAQLLTKYGGDEAKALAAYNAGPGRVDAAGGDLAKLPKETQAYVPNVLQRAQVGTTARGPGAAPAAGPATTPDVARLNQRIAELTRRRDRYAAGSAIDPGLNTYADNLTKQIDELRQERNRLEELPRKVQEQQALLPGQKEVARAGEETKAEMERATREEIDAINRGLPETQRIPYGTTREEIRKKGLVGGIPIPEKGNEELIARSTIVNQLGQLKTAFGDLPTGPIQARLNQYREMLGIDLKDEAVAYSTLLNTVRNRVVNALSGAAVSPDEAKRILAELPDEKTSPQAFKGRLETALKIAEDVYKRRAQYYRRSGHSVPESLMSPYWDEPLPGATGSGAAANKPSSNVDKFKDIRRGG